MKTTILLVIGMISLNLHAQNESAKWNFNFNYLTESYYQYSGPYENFSDLLGPGEYFSQFRGWAVGVDRRILSMKNFDLTTGIQFSKRSHIVSDSRLSSPIQKAELKVGNHYFLSAPISLKYTKSKIVQPGLVIEPGFRIFNQDSGNSVGHLFRGPGQNFLKIMPGVDIKISNRIKLFVGMSYTNYNLFGPQTSHWAGGLQVGIKINFFHRKNR